VIPLHATIRNLMPSAWFEGLFFFRSPSVGPDLHMTKSPADPLPKVRSSAGISLYPQKIIMESHAGLRIM
jgi:hypothetical protein